MNFKTTFAVIVSLSTASFASNDVLTEGSVKSQDTVAVVVENSVRPNVQQEVTWAESARSTYKKTVLALDNTVTAAWKFGVTCATTPDLAPTNSGLHGFQTFVGAAIIIGSTPFMMITKTLAFFI